MVASSCLSSHLSFPSTSYQEEGSHICLAFSLKQLSLPLVGAMEISDEQRMEMAVVERHHPLPSSHRNGDAEAEADVEEEHLWPTKDGPLPIFLKVCIIIIHT